MTTGEGAFSASLDADSEGEEGKFYVWSYDAVIARARHARRASFSPATTTSRRPAISKATTSSIASSRCRAAKRTKRGSPVCARSCSPRREPRVRPGLDDKVLADWNGLMIAALANASLMLAEPSWLDMAERAFAFIARRDDPRRPARSFVARRPAEISRLGIGFRRHDPRRRWRSMKRPAGRAIWIRRSPGSARSIATTPMPTTGTYYLTAADAEGLVIRPASTADEATPNHNAVAAQNLIRLALLTGDDALAGESRPADRRHRAGDGR